MRRRGKLRTTPDKGLTMDFKTLGTTGLRVSDICLGTMTWGQQNSAEDAAEQLDYALSRGINFIDTAEL